MSWQQEEADRYDWLYRDKAYTPGNPMALVKQFGYDDMRWNVVDLGCGHATLNDHFPNYTGVDVSPHIIEQNSTKRPSARFICASLDYLSCLRTQEFDLACVADVMEHVPPDHVDVVLATISMVDARFWAFSICTRDSAWKGPSGESLHPTVRNAFWWEDKLAKYFNINRKHVACDHAMFECLKR